MPRPRSSTFYLPLAPVDAPLSLKAKLSVLPPSAANALLAPRANPAFHSSCAQEANCISSSSSSPSTLSTGHCTVVQEDECARLERVLGLTQGNGAASGGRRNGRRHTDAPLPSGSFSTTAIPPPALPVGTSTGSLAAPSTHRPLPPLAHQSHSDDAASRMDVDAATFVSGSAEMTTTTTTATTSNSLTASTSHVSNNTTPSPTLTGADLSDKRLRTGTPSSSPNAAIISITVTPSHHSHNVEQYSLSLSDHAMDVETTSAAGANGVGSESTSSITRYSFPSPPKPLTTKTLYTDGNSFADNDRSREKAEDACYASGAPEIVSDLVVSSFSSALDLDDFAGACDMLHPSISTSESDATTTQASPTSSPSSLRRSLASSRTATPSNESAPSIKRPTLSLIPCGAFSVWACKPKYSSRLCQTSFTDGEGWMQHSVANASLPSLPESGSLHPSDTRHLLRKEFRTSFPPPAPSIIISSGASSQSYCPAASTADSTAPVQEDEDELKSESSLPVHCESEIAVSSSPPTIITLTPPPTAQAPQQPAPKQPVRQRFRIAPRQLPKVLRRSLGLTTWERAETVRAAKIAERRFGWAACRGIGTHMRGAERWHDQNPMALHMGMSMGANTLVWGGYEEVYSECAYSYQPEYDNAYSNENNTTWGDVASAFEDEMGSWDFDGEEMEDIDPLDFDLESEECEDSSTPMEFVREGAPEPEERLCVEEEPVVEMQRSPSPSGAGSYSMVGRFTWDSDWPTTPTTPSSSETNTSSTGDSALSTPSSASVKTPDQYWMDEDPRIENDTERKEVGFEARATPPVTPYPPAGTTTEVVNTISLMPPLPPKRLRREDGRESEDEEEIFRFSPLHIPQQPRVEDEDDVFRYSPLDKDEDYGTHHHEFGLCGQCVSDPSSPNSAVVVEPPTPVSTTDTESEADEEYFDMEVDMEVQEETVSWGYTPKANKAPPRPLALNNASTQLVDRYPAYTKDQSSPAEGIFIIPPSPLNNNSFGEVQVLSYQPVPGSSTPTASSYSFAQQDTYPGPSSRRSMERIPLQPSRRSFERIVPSRRSLEQNQSPTTESTRSSTPVLVAPRPQRATRALEDVLATQQSPELKSPPLPTSDAPASPTSSKPTSPFRTGVTAWTFGSLKNALSDSVTHLVELARSRSPSPLPWLMRGSSSKGAATASNSISATLFGASAALGDASRPQSEEELESDRASCVTPTPGTTNRSRRASTTTITEASMKRGTQSIPQVTLEDGHSSHDPLSSSPPPKRTLSTSSLSSVESEHDSESGSSGGVFSRSPSPEPSSDSRFWDPAYSLTPRSRPISADAKVPVTYGGRLSPMMIPGSWEPDELWVDDLDTKKAW